MTMRGPSDDELHAMVVRNLQRDRQRRLRPARRGARPVIDDAVVQALLPENREPDLEDRELALRDAPSWRSAGLSPDLVRAWLRAGAYADEAHLATALLAEGVTPDGATQLVTHADTGERLTVLDLARREHRALQPLALEAALDGAGVERQRRSWGWWAAAAPSA